VCVGIYRFSTTEAQRRRGRAGLDWPVRHGIVMYVTAARGLREGVHEARYGRNSLKLNQRIGYRCSPLAFCHVIVHPIALPDRMPGLPVEKCFD
jgi:hypothetical protein